MVHHLLIVCLALLGPWQAEELHLGEPRLVAIDELLQRYEVRDDAIVKFNDRGEELFRSSFNALGVPTHLDVYNPMKPYLFFAGTGTLLQLDNTLSAHAGGFDITAETGRVVTQVCGSYDNHFWLYDQQANELVRVDSQFREVFASGPLFTLVPGLDAVEELVERGNHLYAFQPGWGLAVFDQYGNYLHRHPWTQATGWGWHQKRLVWWNEVGCWISDRSLPEDVSLELPVSPAQIRAFRSGRLLAQLADGWQVYRPFVRR